MIPKNRIVELQNGILLRKNEENQQNGSKNLSNFLTEKKLNLENRYHQTSYSRQIRNNHKRSQAVDRVKEQSRFRSLKSRKELVTSHHIPFNGGRKNYLKNEKKIISQNVSSFNFNQYLPFKVISDKTFKQQSINIGQKLLNENTIFYPKTINYVNNLNSRIIHTNYQRQDSNIVQNSNNLFKEREAITSLQKKDKHLKNYMERNSKVLRNIVTKSFNKNYRDEPNKPRKLPLNPNNSIYSIDTKSKNFKKIKKQSKLCNIEIFDIPRSKHQIAGIGKSFNNSKKGYRSFSQKLNNKKNDINNRFQEIMNRVQVQEITSK